MSKEETLLFAEPEAPSLQPGKVRGTGTYDKPMALPAAARTAPSPAWCVISGASGIRRLPRRSDRPVEGQRIVRFANCTIGCLIVGARWHGIVLMFYRKSDTLPIHSARLLKESCSTVLRVSSVCLYATLS